MLRCLGSLTSIVVPETDGDWDDVGGEMEDVIDEKQIVKVGNVLILPKYIKPVFLICASC